MNFLIRSLGLIFSLVVLVGCVVPYESSSPTKLKEVSTNFVNDKAEDLDNTSKDSENNVVVADPTPPNEEQQNTNTPNPGNNKPNNNSAPSGGNNSNNNTGGTNGVGPGTSPSPCQLLDTNLTTMIQNKINSYRSRTNQCPLRVAMGVTGVRPEDFGALGDGVTDDKLSIQAAIDSARNLNKFVILDSNKIYLISDRLFFRPGVKGLVSSGTGKATLKASSNFPSAPIVFLNSSSQQANVTNMVFQGLKIDGSLGNASYGIFSQNGKKISIYDNEITNYSSSGGGGIYISGYNNSGDIEDICIDNNTVSIDDGESNGKYGIKVRAYEPSNNRYQVTQYWSEHKSIFPFTLKGRRVRVSNNSVDGGYYGIAYLNVHEGEVIDNKIKNNTRNLRFGHGSENLLIDNNIGRNSKSTSILFGYVSNGNVITRNNLATNRATSWGMIEATIGFDNNIIAMNTLSSPTRSPSHHYAIYFGVHANDNLIFDNSISGYFSKAHIALEASQSPHSHSIHRTGAGNYNWQSEGSSNNKIISNHFDILEKTSPLIFLSQTSHSLNSTDLSCNTTTDPSDIKVERLELVSAGTTSGNQVSAFLIN